jgi:hypothetical protein
MSRDQIKGTKKEVRAGSKTKKVRLLYPTAKKKKLPGSNLGELIARLALK